MENLQFVKVKKIPFDGFESLKQESQMEGFNFLKRLKDEWQADINRFSLKGEALYIVCYESELIAIGGINQDPYLQQEKHGRLRRFYVKKSWRRKKVGKALLYFIVENHAHFFETIGLYTQHEKAAAFYLNVGFETVHDEYKITHRWIKSTV